MDGFRRPFRVLEGFVRRILFSAALASFGLLNARPACPMAVRAHVPAGQVAAWVGPIANALRTQGPGKIADLKLQSLSFLAAPGLDFRLEIEVSPAAAGRLVEKLHTAGIEPEAFAAMPAETQVVVLEKAARAAETEANAEAGKALAEHPGKLDYAAARKVKAAAQALWKRDLPYLTAQNRAGLRSLLAEVRLVEERRRELFEAFNRDLPKKIAAAEFDGKNLYVKKDGGWIAADISPEPRYSTLGEAFAEHIEQVRRAPAGPWSEALLSDMEDALRQGHVLEALETEGGESAVRELEGLVAGEKESLALRTRAPDARLSRALLAVREYRGLDRVPSPSSVKTLYAHYDGLFDRMFHPTMKWRIAAWIARGSDEGFPAWAELRLLKERSYAAAQSRAVKATVALIAAIIALPVLSFFELQKVLWVSVPFVALFAAVMAAYVYFLIQRDKLSMFNSRAQLYMDDLFSRI